MMLDLEAMLQIVIVGVCTGIGSSVGHYFSQRAFIKHFDKLSIKK